MKTITLEPSVEAQLEVFVTAGHYPTVTDAVNRILSITLKSQQAYRTGGAATKEIPFTSEELATEEWRPVSYGKGYAVSNLGRIRSGPKIMKLSVINSGHRQVNLSDSPNHKHFLIHRLVAFAFIPNSENKSDVNHMDGNKANNRLSNLEWMSNDENQRHAVASGIRRQGAAHHRSKLTEADVLAIRVAGNAGEVAIDLAIKYGISETQVRNLVQRKSWKHLA